MAFDLTESEIDRILSAPDGAYCDSTVHIAKSAQRLKRATRTRRAADGQEISDGLALQHRLWNELHPNEQRPLSHWVGELVRAQTNGRRSEVCDCGTIFLAFHGTVSCKESRCPMVASREPVRSKPSVEPAYPGGRESTRPCHLIFGQADEPFAAQLRGRIQEHSGVTWRRDLKPGERMTDGLAAMIEAAGVVLFCCSRRSVSSDWAMDELRIAMDVERQARRSMLIPLDLDGHLLSGQRILDSRGEGTLALLRTRWCASFQGWETNPDRFDDGVELVLRSICGGQEKPPIQKL